MGDRPHTACESAMMHDPRRRSGRHVPLFGVLLLVLVAFSGSPRPAENEEVPQGASCELPSELEGTSGHVLTRFTLLDGKINFVKPLFVEADPPGRSDTLAEAVRECLKSSAYPIHPDVPDAGVAEVLQAFHYFNPAKPGAERVQLPGGRWVAKSHVEEIRALRLRFADTLLKGPGYFEVEEGSWTLRTNVHRRERERSGVVDAVRAGVKTFNRLFPNARTEDDASRVDVLLFKSSDQFHQVAALDRIIRGPQPAGQYTPHNRTAYTYLSRRDSPPRISIGVLVHEVTHHMVHERLAGGKRDVPFWVDEGVATFVQLFRPKKKADGGLSGFTRGKQTEAGFSWIAPGSRYLDRIRRRLTATGSLHVEEFLSGRFDKLDLDVEEAYGLSWLLVHYLINGEGGALRDRFEKWATTTMGQPDDTGIAASLERTPTAFEAGLVEHINSLRG